MKEYKRNHFPGTFIVFEGLDGSGQSTQAGLLRDFFIQKGFKALLTKEPTAGTEAGKKIRKILDKKIKSGPRHLQELYAQDREEHLKNVIVPGLQKGKIVISDRYFFSSFAFGRAHGAALDYLLKINKNFLIPDITFFLDVRTNICLERIQKRGNARTLFENKEKFEKVYQNYKNVFKKFKDTAKIHFINGGRPIKKVFEQVQKKITTPALKFPDNPI